MNRFTGYSHQLQRHIRHHTIHWVSDQYGQQHNDNHQHQNFKCNHQLLENYTQSSNGKTLLI